MHDIQMRETEKGNKVNGFFFTDSYIIVHAILCTVKQKMFAGIKISSGESFANLISASSSHTFKFCVFSFTYKKK